MRESAFFRQCVFQFVSSIGQRSKAAGSGVTLESVDYPPDSAHSLRVTLLVFQLEGGVIQRFQQFLRALKKYLAQFRAALVGRPAHDAPSTF